jgi:hypothetical protein
LLAARLPRDTAEFAWRVADHTWRGLGGTSAIASTAPLPGDLRHALRWSSPIRIGDYTSTTNIGRIWST